MLSQLRIRDYVLIDDLTVELRPGLTVLTGETGAGKSIIVGALSLLLGEKPDLDMIRSGSDRTSVEGRFTDAGVSTEACRSLGIELADGDLILRRRVERAGRGAAHANDTGITLSGLAAVADLLVDLHGQHQHQLLLRTEVHLDLLDAYAGLLEERTRLARTYAESRETIGELQRIESELARRRERRELVEFQWKELADAGIRAGLALELNAERELLQTAERRHALAAQLVALLTEQEGSASELLAACSRSLTDLASLDPGLAAHRDQLAQAESAVSDLWREVLRYRDSIDFSPERLEQVNMLLFSIEKLERKHSVKADELPAVQEALRRELDSIETDESRLPELRQQAAELDRAARSAAAAISRRRRRAGGELEEKLAGELAPLGLADSRFSVGLEPGSEWQVVRGECTGTDSAEFLFSANPGEELRPLHKVASGGELSRIMLALKTVLARVDLVPTMVFDEIDTGIGGRVAESVGRALSALGRTRQVICITHLPQIARHADDHLLVVKSARSGRTTTSLRRLADDERVRELARMAGGERVTETALAHARELLKTAPRSRSTGGQ